MLIRLLVSVWWLLACIVPQGAFAAQHEQFAALVFPNLSSSPLLDIKKAYFHGSNPTSSACPFGVALGDGCGVSPGIYYAPAVSATTKPSASQWYAYAATSGQTWTSPHPQPFNVAAVDYGLGPNALFSTFPDIAGWNTNTAVYGQLAPLATKCVYMPSQGNTATFTGQVTTSGGVGTLTVSGVTGTIVPGMELETGPSGVAANTYILAGSGTTWTINTTGTYGPETITATDTYNITGWTAGAPAFVCSGTTQPDFAISGWNGGPTAYQGSPVGTHDCVNFIVVPTNGTTYTPKITIQGNAFINGATCAPEVNGVHYGMISVPLTSRASLKIWNNYVDGRASDAGRCCLPPGNQGFFVETNALQANVDVEFNYILGIASAPLGVGFSTGNEAAFPCTNGTAYSTPGYNFIDKFNYYDQFGSVYGAGHTEIAAMEANAGTMLCTRYDDYNTILWAGSAAASGAATFFYWGGPGSLEYAEAKNTTIITNLTGGKQYPELYDYYNWNTTNSNPNFVAISATGTNCSGLSWSCSNPVQGQSISGGTGNTFNSVIGLQNNTGSGPIAGSAWNAGCNQFDNASGLCPTSGDFPAIAANVAIPSGGGSVTNSFFNNRVVSETASEADHGTTSFYTTTAGAGSSGASVVLSGACPTASGANTPINSQLTDTTGATVVGTVKSCAAGTVTLWASAAFAVQSGDALTFAAFSYGTIVWGPNYIDGGSSGVAPNSIPQYWSANPQTNGNSGGFASGLGGGGCAVPVTLTSNIELRTGGSATYPQVNQMTSSSAGCPFTPAWQVSKIGGGGNIIRLEVYPDGTMLSGTDVQIPYIWTGSGPWKRLLTSQTAPPFAPGTIITSGTYAVAACAYDTNQSATLRGSTSILYTGFNNLIYVSTNQGANWTNTGQAIAGNVNGEPNNSPYIWCDPASSGQVAYVGQLTGSPLKTTNGGTTWTAVSGITAPTLDNGTAIQGDPSSTVTSGVTQHVFISSAGTGVYESYNGGTSFTPTSSGPTVIRQMSVDQFGVTWVLDNTNSNTKLWKYVPNGSAGGGTWTTSVTNPGGQAVAGFAINPNAASEAAENIVIAAIFGGIVGSTTDGGGSWTTGSIFTPIPPTSTDIPWLGVAGYIASSNNFLDINFIGFDTSGNLFAALGVAVFKATGPIVGNTFPAYVDQTAGIENMVSAQAITVPGLGPFNGFWDRGIFSNLNADVYPASQYTNATAISGGWDVTYAISTPTTLTQINASNIGSGDFSAVSTDGGHSWTPWANFTYTTSGNPSFGGSIAAVSPTDWIAVGLGGDLLCTTNGAATPWSTIAMPGGNPTNAWVVDIRNGGPSHLLTADKVTAGVYYAYANTVGLYSSVGGCAGTWTKVFSGTIGATGGDSWAKLDSVPGHTGHLYYAPSSFATGGLYNSTNGGVSWSAVPNFTNVSSFGFGATKPGSDGYPTIYVDGFLSGVYGVWQGVNIDATPTWKNLSPGAWPGYDVQGVYGDGGNVVTGDINVYGRVTDCNLNSSCYYYDTADACPWVNFDTSIIYPTISLTGTVNLTSLHSGLVPVTSVQYSVDGSNVGSPLTGAGPYTFAWATGGVATGAHTLKVTATGANCSGSFSIPITTH